MEVRSQESESNSANNKNFGEKAGFFSRLFGCWHGRMSRPVTTENTSYKFCSDCGARKRFDPVTFKTDGGFYYPGHRKDVYNA